MKKQTITPLAFFWPIIKPYRHYYFLMILAPIASSVYPVIYNFVVKKLIDLFTENSYLNISKSIVPVVWFIGAHALVDIAWRMHNFAQLKSMPYVLEDLLCKTCEHCFYLPYTYYQNNLSGSTVSKIKGVGDKYVKIHQAIEHNLSIPLLVTFFSGVALAFTNLKIFAFISTFTLIYSPVAFFFFQKLAKIEKQKQDSWYHLFGSVSDRISNIFTIFSFATRAKEILKIKDYYKKVRHLTKEC